MGTVKEGYTPPKKFRIIRDSREQKGKGWNFKASSNCWGQKIQKLNVGDYTVEGLEKVLMIERKTIGDLWGTLGNTTNYKRFLREINRANSHKLKFLVIEGNVTDVNRGYKYSKVSSENIHAKLVSLQVKHNVHVIFAGRKDVARSYVRKLMHKVFRYNEDGIL